MTILPINNKTLVSGTSDGGKTIKSECKEINLKLEKAAKILNLKPHFVDEKLTFGPCDLEGFPKF